MLGCFPRPGDDELLYSVVARYGFITGCRVGTQLILDFFGAPVGATAVDLPSHIDRLVERIPPGQGFDRDRIIGEHTLFPYQLRFAPPEVAAAVHAYMAGDGSKRPTRVGVMAAAFPARKRMMLCAACAREDAAASGIGAWRRVHQLPGVLVCPRHGRPLLETSVPRLERRGKGALMPIIREIRAAAQPLVLPPRTADHLLEFARRSETLLRSQAGPCNVGDLQRRLRALLADYRWSRAPSLIHMEALVADFRRHPGIRAVMSAINLAWTDGQLATALNRLVYREAVAKHPLMVLMVLELAGASVADLSAPEVAAAPAPVRQLPVIRIKAAVRHDLPCGNPACARFRGEIIAPEAAAPPLRAECAVCGYVYVLDPRRPGGTCTLETGAVWDSLLASTLAGGEIGIRAASRALGVAPTTVMRHARRLGLWRDEWKDRPKLSLRKASQPERLLERHRAGWIEFRTAGVSVPTKEMPKAAFNAYRYLIRKDRSWLEQNQPLRRM